MDFIGPIALVLFLFVILVLPFLPSLRRYMRPDLRDKAEHQFDSIMAARPDNPWGPEMPYGRRSVEPERPPERNPDNEPP